jgi:hypothetical protein
MTRYEQIQAIFKKALESDWPSVPIGDEMERGRNLDAQLGRDFTAPLKQWEDGDISACELLDMLNRIATQEVK